MQHDEYEQLKKRVQEYDLLSSSISEAQMALCLLRERADHPVFDSCCSIKVEDYCWVPIGFKYRFGVANLISQELNDLKFKLNKI